MASYDSDDEVDYATDPAWAHITPLPQDDGENPLAQIAYHPDYVVAMSYLRGVMSINYHSAQVLKLTADIIGMNAAHYTVWGYRFKTLMALEASNVFNDEETSWSWRKELDWVQSIAKQYEKNYQIWHHRQLIINHLNDSTGERERTNEMFASDSKNYHVWTYRQWLVKRFNLFDKEELDTMELLLKEDVRNNSAWNHRYFITLGRLGTDSPADGVINREIEFAKVAISSAPQNPSPWNYLKAVLRKGNIDLASLKDFCEQFAPIDSEDKIKSSHALDILSEIYDETGNLGKAEQALVLLAAKYDPVRKNYWRYRKRLLGSKENVPTASEKTPIVHATA
ncbi:CAAX geranylgeranyltransferase alpha subunit [Orbilia oligospora]|uniref:Protein farnesyltransferase/geranylgeranyltransferase type-1 subunit alpha n=1 Tax=Orbilia oligospora TaxID=2813651 RepID=A0A7C8NE95_ORBOL|nr:CAAX geranylgeranyltransferase alpha subunit [Orbilia oligospora]KAF3097275.1 CAAX geranylgeranyltransferase alpha subunit [Orbilia oligospora]KAF3103122.1 CAAX geranylgeranyltransferase alpha subunit [Orbilia oligospora]KAF3138642.1 CAAX geranylgeranyltransferase alpha subunit [Orbilia oligospora]KAF3142407.1 CAAX geranylgeranyltransferase alpha subunit [Orbilia oligospora]